MPTRTNYESTIAPASYETLGTGPNAANLGKRNQTTLDNAFGAPNGAGEVSRTTEGSQLELLRIAREKLSDYAGENPMFQEYRRDFVPAGGTLTEEYVDPRNKNLSKEQIQALKLGTAYTPTIASPGAAAGIDPNALTSVSSDINGVKADEAGLDNQHLQYTKTPTKPMKLQTLVKFVNSNLELGQVHQTDLQSKLQEVNSLVH